MNTVVLMGNLASDVRSNDAGGTTFAGFTLAVNKRSKDGNNKADFFQVKAAGKTAENIIKFFTKGKPIIIEGSLSTEKWKDNTVTIVFARTFHFVGGKKDSDNNSQSQGGATDNSSLW